MIEQQEPNIYSRAAILQWAADILHGEYTCFGDVPAKDVAVLLHAIFNSPCRDQKSDCEGTIVSLHDIQFCDNPTSTTRFLNAKRVLALVQMLSSSSTGTKGEKSSLGTRLVPSGVGNMTPCAWMEGKAFVEELKMWRWIRAESFRRGLEKNELESRVQAFLGKAADCNVTLPAEEQTSETVGNQSDVGKRASSKEGIALPRKRLREEEAPAAVISKIVSETIFDPGSGCQSSSTTIRHPEEGAQSERGARPTVAPVVTPPPHDDEVLRDEQGSMHSIPGIACNGVGAASQLLDVLEKVKKELEDQKLASGDDVAVARDTESQVADKLYSSSCFLAGCSSCPTVFTTAVQQNFVAIEKLEAVRRKAVAACLKRDVVDLLEALAFV